MSKSPNSKPASRRTRGRSIGERETLPLLPQATGEVSALKPLAADPNMRQVHVGRRCVATLRACDLQAMGIEIGTPWTAELERLALQAVAANAARHEALKMLGRRGFSRGELIDRLVRKGHERTAAQSIADELSADQWMDDAKYARGVIDEIRLRKHVSHDFLLAQLESRQIEPRLAQRIVRDAMAGFDDVHVAVEAACGKLKAMKTVSPTLARRRIAGMLARKGFDDDVIAQALDRIGLASDESRD